MADPVPEIGEAAPRMRAAWMAGRSALDQCPADWRALAGQGPQAEAALAALVSHAGQTLFRPAAPQGLAARPVLPALPHPTPGAASRARLRRLLEAKGGVAGAQDLVLLLAARGYVTHPFDWMPGASDDWAPAAYGPWLAWAAGTQKAPASGDVLTVETYDDWSWPERRAALIALRGRDPAAARAIVAGKAASEPAERRLTLIAALVPRLSAEDIPVLQAFSKDRSDRVETLARQLLLRLGHTVGEGGAGLAQELAAMVELSRSGLIRRRSRLALKKLKTAAQENRRRELLGLVGISELAAALGASEGALVESLPEGDVQAVGAFVLMVCATGSDAARQALTEQIIDDASGHLGHLIHLAQRAGREERLRNLPRVMARERSPMFGHARSFAGDALGSIPFKTLAVSPAFKSLRELMHAAGGSNDGARRQAEPNLHPALGNLGLLLDAAGARSLIDMATSAGVSAADPCLDLLYLNAALEPERPL